jgi:hypothetical protein
MTPETKVKKEIVAYLDTLPECWHVAIHNMGYGKRGVPDRLVCYRGYFIALEVKAPGGKATAWQERCLAEIQKAGGWSEVVHSADDVRRLIAHINLNYVPR